MTLAEFSKFISQSCPLNLIYNAERQIQHMSEKLLETLSFNSNEEDLLLGLIDSGKKLDGHKLTLKRKNTYCP